MRGEWPQASMKRMRSCVASRVVAVFSSGWQLTSAKLSSVASTTTMTSAAARIDQRQRRNRAGCNTEHGLEQLAFAEAEAPGVEPRGQRLEIDPRVVLGDDEHHVAVLVGEEQGLGMRAGEFPREGGRLLDREHRRVLDRRRGDTELVQPGEKRFAVRAHGVSLSGGEVDIRAMIH